MHNRPLAEVFRLDKVERIPRALADLGSAALILQCWRIQYSTFHYQTVVNYKTIDINVLEARPTRQTFW